MNTQEEHIDTSKPDDLGKKLYKAVRAGKYDEVKNYIAQGANVNYVFMPDKYHTTALHMAAYYANEKLVELLLKNGSDVNANNILGKTPLALAKERHGRGNIIFLLEQWGGLDGTTPIPDAANVGDVYYTVRNTYLLVGDDGKLSEIKKYRVLALEEIDKQRQEMKRFGQTVDLDFSDGKFKNEEVYYGFFLPKENPEAMLRFAEYNLEMLQNDKWNECTIPGVSQYDKESFIKRYQVFVDAAYGNNKLYHDARNLSVEFHSWLEYESGFKDTMQEFYHAVIMNVGDMLQGDFEQNKQYIKDNRDFTDMLDENQEFLRESAAEGLERYEKLYVQLEQKSQQILKEEEKNHNPARRRGR